MYKIFNIKCFGVFLCLGCLASEIACSADIIFVTFSLWILGTHQRFEYSVVLTSIKISVPLAELHCALSHRVVRSRGVMGCDRKRHSVSLQHTHTHRHGKNTHYLLLSLYVNMHTFVSNIKPLQQMCSCTHIYSKDSHMPAQANTITG